MNTQIKLNRFDKTCIRAFFTLPEHLRNILHTKYFNIHSKPFNPVLRDSSSIIKDKVKYYIIWFDDPEIIQETDTIDLSFRDFSHYLIPPTVLIRKSSV